MKKITLSFMLLLCSCIVIHAQTQLVIIGTEHQPGSHFNEDTLFNVLEKIKPDVILQELDTSLMDADGNYKGMARTINEVEEVTCRKYRETNPKVIFRCFDIVDRNAYYSSHHTFAVENKLSRAVDSLYQKNALRPYYMQIISALYDVNMTVNILSDMDIKTFNSPEFMKLTSFKQYWMYDKQLEIIANTPELKQYYEFYKEDGDFWQRRNKTMIKNIEGYLSQFKGKRIVVLTGATHKYFLTDGLLPQQATLGFKLTDLPN